jgi:RNA polymerase sigma factor (sigma-70 family)
MMDDLELLRRHAELRDETAFAELVRRHIDFVYHAALRRVGGDTHLAQDVTQQVFVVLAREARTVARRPVLVGWLFGTTRNIAAQLVRTERRRREREQEAQIMRELLLPETSEMDWTKLQPVLDGALDALREHDREAVLLRFFEQKSFAEIGTKLSVAENTARMRVDRALEKLRRQLARRGVESTAVALGLVLANQPVVAAPAGLAVATTGAALAGGLVLAPSAGALAAFMSLTKLQVGATVAIVVVGTATVAIQTSTQTKLQNELAALRRQNQAVAALRVENARLKRVADEANAARAAAAERERLQAEVAALRARVRSVAGVASRLPGESAAAAPFTGVAFEEDQVDVKAKISSRAPLIIPQATRKSGADAKALADMVVDEGGHVRNAVIVNATDPAFGDAALAAVGHWEFQPARKGDRAVAMHTQVQFEFHKASDDESRAAGQSFVPWF